MTQEILKRVYCFAAKHNVDDQHARQVCRLALDIFDQLANFHQLSQDERFLLECAAILHDIGWCRSGKKHHKIARDMIMNEEEIPWSAQDRISIALIARYHRGAMPMSKHRLFEALNPQAQDKVCILSSLLRVADGLDARHMSIVKKVVCHTQENRMMLTIIVHGEAKEEEAMVYEKADLWKRVFKQEICVHQTLT